jgi:hypothetical protein
LLDPLRFRPVAGLNVLEPLLLLPEDRLPELELPLELLGLLPELLELGLMD